MAFLFFALPGGRIDVAAAVDQLPLVGGNGEGAVEDDVFVFVCLQGEPFEALRLPGLDGRAAYDPPRLNLTLSW